MLKHIVLLTIITASTTGLRAGAAEEQPLGLAPIAGEHVELRVDQLVRHALELSDDFAAADPADILVTRAALRNVIIERAGADTAQHLDILFNRRNERPRAIDWQVAEMRMAQKLQLYPGVTPYYAGWRFLLHGE